MSDEPRFAGDMRWLTRWQDEDGNVYSFRAYNGVLPVRVLQVAVPTWLGDYSRLDWEDVPEVDET